MTELVILSGCCSALQVAESVAGWFELATGVVAVERLCTVEVRVHSTSGAGVEGEMWVLSLTSESQLGLERAESLFAGEACRRSRGPSNVQLPCSHSRAVLCRLVLQGCGSRVSCSTPCGWCRRWGAAGPEAGGSSRPQAQAPAACSEHPHVYMDLVAEGKQGMLHHSSVPPAACT